MNSFTHHFKARFRKSVVLQSVKNIMPQAIKSLKKNVALKANLVNKKSKVNRRFRHFQNSFFAVFFGLDGFLVKKMQELAKILFINRYCQRHAV